ncbi:MAG TPA: phage terminase large subunit [Pyrinomonadaceae bacterium]|jgi:predicted phage terminase large subunit-like protein|nr:phage terminase large subunit [Pyrinomonadaceae bacterium]
MSGSIGRKKQAVGGAGSAVDRKGHGRKAKASPHGDATSRKQSPFAEWLRATTPLMEWDARHLDLLRKKLDRVTSGDCDRLMIFMPPRHGKSETVTVHYAAWRLEQDASLNVIIGCHSQKLADRFSRKVRRIAKDHELGLSPERKAVEDWETRDGGGMRAVGVGAGITGFGGGLVIIDDPVKSRADAESETKRDKTYDWFTDDIYTRLAPHGQIILIQTRWHEDDLAGRLLKRAATGEGEKWDVLRLPALSLGRKGDPLIRHAGHALWPQHFGAWQLKTIRRALGHYSFESLYQQNPVPKDGDLFKRQWFVHTVDAPPKGLVWVRAYDLAISTATSADYTASFRVARAKDGKFYIDGAFVRRLDYPAQRRFVIDRVRQERDTVHYVEEALHGRAMVQDLKLQLGPDAHRLKLRPVAADKFTRALPLAAAAEDKRVYLVKGKWNHYFVDEACSFPKGRHDDQVDAVTLAIGVIEGRKGKRFYTFD